jgi:hypothetical protein
VSAAARCSRRRAIILLARATALLPALGALIPRRPAFAATRPAGLDVATVVALHLDQLARCGPAGMGHAARIRPALLAAARRRAEPPGPAAVRTAFALMEHIGEFPPTHGPRGGSQ